MNNLFSSFDPQARVLFFNFRFNWISATFVFLIVPQIFWLVKNQFSLRIINMAQLLVLELRAVLGRLAAPGTFLLFVSFFFFIIFSNFIGLFPYVFTPSRHLVFTLSLSLPLWLGSIVWATVYQFNSVMSHLVPLGTPAPLIPVMVIIESVRSIIRPFTLAIRLAANMIAGHLLLTLLGRQGSLELSGKGSLVLVSLVALLTLECAVACIQSYVFTILSSLYLGELATTQMAKRTSI